VLSQGPVAPGAVIRCRPISALLMEDENGVDEKIIAVPVDELNPFYDDIGELTDLPPIFRDQIEHFFRRYKDLERGKWVKLTGWADPEKARALIMEAISRIKPA
jgi:inorganic pyrophosphatase